MTETEESLMPFAVTYDVISNHTEFKKKLFKQGFYNCVQLERDSKQKLLPNTTVLHSSDDPNHVEACFKRALKATTPSPGLEKVFYIHYDTFWLQSDTYCR